MDQLPLEEREFEIDLEAGENTCDEARQADNVSAANSDNNLFDKLFRGYVSADVLEKGENGGNLKSSNGSVTSPERVKLLMDEKVQGEEVADLKENNIGRDKRKTLSAKKPPKPPRPPRGLSLDAADQKLIKEFAQLAMMKRARTERMKALKKMKAAKASSSSSSGNLFAMLFTVIFCLVLLFQGVSSRSSTASFAGSPESARVIDDGSILNANHWNPSTSGTELPSSVSPNSAEQFATLYRESKGSREARLIV
ncbi:Galactokinase family protein [Heracleum sosnowskyi]|uniref:Galactokinase family protein n=1 Tax=Heracleum sosnowskyi TaxID=360622 RepID=A0AAD8GMZ0_9APIA|nr:Galactokinase family protein [Heracleum sosnowskyi]